MKATVKRLMAMLLVLAMVMTLLPTFAFADETVTATKVDTIADGDQIVWYNVGSGKAIDTQGTSGFYNAGVDVTVTNGVMTVPQTSIIWTIKMIEGTETFYMMQDGKYLSSNTYTSTEWKTTPDEKCVWEYTEEGYVHNIAKPGYMEWFASKNCFSCFNTDNPSSDIFVFEAYKIGGGGETGEDKVVNFDFLVTSDLHGQIYATDYTADESARGTYKRGLTRIASYIKDVRAEYGDNTYVADMGDTIQGAPMTYYYAFNKPEVDDPAIKAFRTIGYDMWVVGNHEFNYGLNILQRQLKYAVSPSTETEKQLTVCMANYLDSRTNSDETKDWATWNGYEPYVIKEFDGVKVAIIGFGNPNIPKWDIPANWEGIYFANIIDTYKHYEQEMLEKADMIVAIAHSGVNSDEGADFMERLVEQTNTIAFAFSGHEHGNKVWTFKNSDGKDIPVLQPYTKARAIAEVKVAYNVTKDSYEITPEVKNMENYRIDEDLAAVLKPYEDTTWDEYMLQKIGEASADFSAANLGTAPSAFMDLINTVQLWGAYDRTGENTPDDTTDDTMAQLSISAPLTSGDNANIIDKGDIFLGDMFKLYRFENWFYQIRMSGKEVRTWLEFAATKIKLDAEGKPTVSTGDLTYYDVIYGEGFSYTIDYTKPEGSRIVSMTYHGNEVAEDDEFTVIVNNYRYNGGGNYVKYLNEHGCEFVANDPDRIIYSTQFDMIQGEDKGQARNLLTDYITMKGVIDPVITSTWKLTDGGDEPSKDITVYFTNDVHGAYENYARLATVVKDGDLLLDAGDNIQGSVATTLTKGQCMVDLMKAVGYDLAVPGNHEFDYGFDRFLEIVTNKENTPYVSANLWDKTADKPVLDAYKMFEVDGLKVAVVGITTPETLTKSTPAYFQDKDGNWLYDFCNDVTGEKLYSVVQKAVDEATEAGADYVIALGHLGIDEQSEPWTSKSVIANTTGIDALIDGHSHSTFTEVMKNKNGEDVTVAQTGTKLEKVGKLTIGEDGIHAELIDITEEIAEDETVKAAVDAVKEEVEKVSNTVVATTEVELTTKDPDTGKRAVRSAETNLGDLCADAYRDLLGTDIAFVNGGGVRADIAKGDITYGQIIAVHPFGNTACKIEVTGQQIIDALELGSAANPGESGGFLQVSGITYTIDNGIPSTVTKDENGMFTGVSGERRVKDVKVGGEPIDVTKTYTLGGHNYMLLLCGDGYTMFKDAKVLAQEVAIDNQVLIRYITETLGGEIKADSIYANPRGEGRIKIVTSDRVCAEYSDINVEAWYHDYVHYAAENGLMTGVGNGNWGIGNQMTRAQLVQVLYAMEGKPEMEYTGRFADVAKDTWYAKAVEWAAENGIVAGTGNGFNPNGLVDRQQTVVIMKAYAKYKGYDTGATKALDEYVDHEDASTWAVSALEWATAIGLLNSTSTTELVLAPKTTSTREVFATILYKFVNTKFEAYTITVYSTNDVHGAYENYARLATVVKDGDLLLDAGDNIQGSVATTLTKGQCMVDLMKAVGYDLAVPGNHEFDYGFDRFLEIVTNKENTPYVSANLWDKTADKPVLDAYKMFEVDGLKVAVVGITTPETLTKSTPAYFQDKDGNWIYDFCNDATGEKLYSVVQKAVDEATAAGADYVIALGHLGIDEQSEPWTSESVIAHTTGIDALIDGHSHSTFTKVMQNKNGEDVAVSQTGTKLENVGKLVITKGSVTTELVPITEEIEEDETVKAAVETVKEEVEKVSNTVVATTEVELTTKDPDTGKRAVRSAETNLGDLCADAYRDLLGTDIAFVNGGGVRADIAKGDITYGQIIAVHPFGNTACKIEVTGQQIIDALELGSAANPGESGGFLQVSGITYTIDNGIPSTVTKDENGMFTGVSGERRVKDVKVGGEPIDVTKTYTLGGHNYMLLLCGDGYTMFKDAKVLAQEVAIDNQVLIRYITETLNGKIAADSVYANPRGEGRITILTAQTID